MGHTEIYTWGERVRHIGPVTVPFGTTVNVIFSQVPGIRELVNGQYEQLDYNIVWMLRAPRVLLGFIVGASLAVCGVAMQALIRNKLADPFVLGGSRNAAGHSWKDGRKGGCFRPGSLPA